MMFVLSTSSYKLALTALLATSAVIVDAAPYQLKVKYDTGNSTGNHGSIRPTAGHAASTAAIHSTVTSSSIMSTGSASPQSSNVTTSQANNTSIYQHEGLVPTLNPWFNASGAWLTKNCSSPDFAGQTIDPDGAKLWEEADADTALTQLMAAWNSRPANMSDWTFSRFVWSVFNQNGGNNEGPHVDCSDPYNTVCSLPIKCDPSTGIAPAGYLIINSMVTIHNIYQMQYNGMSDAYNSISGAMQYVVDNFDWQPKPNNDLAILNEILSIFSAALGAVSGGTFSEAINAIKVFGTLTEKTANTVHKVASTGIGLTQDILGELPAPAKQGDILGYLNAILETGFDGLHQGVTSMLSTLVQANGQSNQTLFQDFMSTGLLLDYYNVNTNNTGDLQNVATSVMYGQIIPAAWSLSVQGLRPFILRMDAKDMQCNGSFPKGSDGEDISSLFDKNVAKDALWCDDEGNSYWLLNGVHQDQCVGLGCLGDDNKPPFGMLPGGNSSNLNGNNWGGLHLGDIIRSAWGGFQANNKQNGYSIPQGTSEQVAANMTFEGSNGLPLSGGTLTPGFFNFTICLDYTEALKTLRGSDKSAPICGTSPSPGDSSTGLNAAGAYTPGWCRLHVNQYQRNEGNENPLNNYQLEINIFDSASLLIGDATKQSAAEPLAIVDSVLPARLIVAPGAGDDDPISFWYADQYWQSDSTANQCGQGKYDSGMRQIDCGFQCPLPSSGSPPVSATVAHALPGAPTDAVAGTATFVNTYITATPTPTPTGGAPPPKPTPTYATGQCGVHVRQYQKNEKNENPTGNYEIEATLFDGKQKAIGTSGQVPAPDNSPVTVNGLVSPFTITAYAVDSDGLKFNFNGAEWWSNSTSCGVGKYDSGHRDMDCGFQC